MPSRAARAWWQPSRGTISRRAFPSRWFLSSPGADITRPRGHTLSSRISRNLRGATIFYAEDAGEIAGFSTHEANNRGLGFFGPTGVAEKFRGRGFGRRLLLASLADLRRLGYHRVVIPWTDAIEYYRKSCGARIDQRFVILRKNG